jgi:hypothetical protein
MFGRKKVTIKFIIIYGSDFTVISNFEMMVTSKIVQIHIRPQKIISGMWQHVHQISMKSEMVRVKNICVC